MFGFSRVFSSGRFDYFCEVHPSMTGIVSVQMGQGITSDGYPLLIWADDHTGTGKVFDVRYRVGEGQWRNWKNDTDKVQGAFGRNDRPVHWNPAKEYHLRARSQKSAAKPNAHSRWSPVELWG